MSYLINKTNGLVLATVLDGQIDRSSSSLVLIGKRVSDYGEIQNENFVKLLENFANSVGPQYPLAGQLWWDTASNSLQVFDSTVWRPATGFTSANTAPLSSYVGDQWWDKINQQYKVFNGTSWSLVGPAYSALDGVNGAVVDTVYDTLLNKHVVVKLYNNGAVSAIISRAAVFTPNVSIAGFTTVNPGVTFTTSVNAFKLYGTATNADTVGNIAATQFIRNDADSISNNRLSIRGQLDVGTNNELNVLSDGTGGVTIRNTISNGNIVIRANVAGQTTTVLHVNGSSGLVSALGDPSIPLGLATKQYTDAAIVLLRNDTSNYITANLSGPNSGIAGVQANITAANAAISSLSTLKAPVDSPALTGIPTAPTATPGTSSTQIATTAFVTNLTGIFDTTRLYNGASSIKVNTANVALVVSGTTIAVATTAGLTVTTQPAGDNSTKVATTAYADTGDKNFVLNSVNYRPTCYVSDLVPNNAVGVDGDIWFQYT